MTPGARQVVLGSSSRRTPPTGLGWPYSSISFFFQGGKASASVDPRSLVDSRIWTGPAYHVDPIAGNDVNTGIGAQDGDFTNAVQRIKQAHTLGNATAAPYRVILKTAGSSGDSYSQSFTLNGTAGTSEPTQPCAYIAWGGRVTHGAYTTETWPASKDATYTNTYIGGPSSAVRVFDRTNLTANGTDAYGNAVSGYTELTQVTGGTDASRAASVDATLGSWCISNVSGSNKVHVRRTDDARPTLANTHAYRNINVAQLLSCTSDLYFENIDFVGGPLGALWIDPISTRNVVIVGCTASYGGYATQLLDGFRIRRTQGLVALFGCGTQFNAKDGFNFHQDNATNPLYWLTVKCWSRNNGGRFGSTSNNSYTAHEACVGIDVGSVGGNNTDGAPFHCIDTTKTWCLGTRIDLTSQDVGASSVNSAFKVTTGQMWLEDCTANCGSSTYPAVYAQAPTGSLYFRRFQTTGAFKVDSGCTIAAF